MGSLLRRTLKNDTVRSGLYLGLGIILFLIAAQAFVGALREARRPLAQTIVGPVTETPAEVPERYVPPAPLEYPFF